MITSRSTALAPETTDRPAPAFGSVTVRKARPREEVGGVRQVLHGVLLALALVFVLTLSTVVWGAVVWLLL